MEFNINRFGNLIKRDFITYKKASLYGLLSIIGFLAFIYLFAILRNRGMEIRIGFWEPVYYAFLFILGLTFTSIVFRDFKTPAGRLQFLSLPASNLEKLGSRWLYSLILFPLAVTILVWLASVFTITDGTGLFALLRSEEFGWISLGFVLLHANMFLYAVWFNNYVILKSSIIGLITTIVFGLIMSGMFWLFFNNLFEGPLRIGPSIHTNMSAAGQQFLETKILPIGAFLLKFFLAPFLWVVSYFKMKEKEA